MEMDSATGSIYLGDPRVDRHLIIWNTHSIFPSSWFYTLLPSVHSSTQLVWYIMAGYLSISSHPLSTLLELEPLFLMNSLRIPCKVRGSVDDELSAYNLQCFTTSWSSEFRDALQGRNPARVEIHMEAVIEWVWRCTWRPWSCELGGRDRASVEIHLQAVIERVWRCTWRPWSS